MSGMNKKFTTHQSHATLATYLHKLHAVNYHCTMSSAKLHSHLFSKDTKSYASKTSRFTSRFTSRHNYTFLGGL